VTRRLNPDRLRHRLREHLKEALIARDSTAVAAFRSVIGAIDNAEAVDAPAATGGPAVVRLGVGAAETARRELSAEDLVDVIEAEIKERTAASAEYRRLDRAEQASRLRAEATILRSFLENEIELPLERPPAST